MDSHSVSVTNSENNKSITTAATEGEPTTASFHIFLIFL